jgi:hypothetical protein
MCRRVRPLPAYEDTSALDQSEEEEISRWKRTLELNCGEGRRQPLNPTIPHCRGR